MGDGNACTGAGFFGAPDSPNIVLTNAHVVGMLAPDSRRPFQIDVFINSGEKDEKKTSAVVLGVDRASDLAVLRVGATEGMPKPLTVKSASALTELDKLYVFGFPLGERLGQEITIRPASVSPLRKKDGVLDKIQVNGGMDEGNSGGPVVDEHGDVIGVAVSGIPGRQINFAIPDEHVHVFLTGRSSAPVFSQPYRAEGGKVAVPVAVEVLDPRNRVKEVSLEVWTGDGSATKPAQRPPANAPPVPVAGDSPRRRFRLTYLGGEAKGEIILPDLPAGKVYWFQPVWVDNGEETHWGQAESQTIRPNLAVERKPALLVLRHTKASRTLALTVSNSFRVGGTGDEAASLKTRVRFSEQVIPRADTGATINLVYREADRHLVVGGARQPSKLMEAVRPNLNKLVGLQEVDAAGDVALSRVANAAQLARTPEGKQLLAFHEPIRLYLEATTIPLPGRTVNAQESWQTRQKVGIKTPTGDLQKVQLDLTFTYLGLRRRNGRSEAVIALAGVIPALGGRASGTVLFDLNTGQVSKTEVRTVTELGIAIPRPGGRLEKIKAISTMVIRLERAL
jgi:hypothetical protein